MSRFVDFLRDVFLPGETYQMTYRTGASEQLAVLAVAEFAARMAENMISALISKCEFKTFLDGEERKGEEWYRWNFAPNYNQGGADFKARLARKIARGEDTLVVELNGGLYVAESYMVSNQTLFPATFTNIQIEAPDGSLFTLDRGFRSDGVLLFRSGNSDVPALLRNIGIAYDALTQMAEGKYKRAGGRRGVAKIRKTPSGDAAKQQEYQKAVESIFRKYFTEENGIAVLNDSIEFSEAPNQAQTGSQNEVNNLATLTREAFARAAQAYRIPPALLQGEIAETGTLMDQLLTVCIDPLVTVLQTEINRKRFGQRSLERGSRMIIDTTCIEHVDIFNIAGKADKLIADGVCSIDEIRTLIGLLPIETWWSEKHWMTKNYDGIEAAGEEKDEEQILQPGE